jgi:hypothetical protein
MGEWFEAIDVRERDEIGNWLEATSATAEDDFWVDRFKEERSGGRRPPRSLAHTFWTIYSVSALVLALVVAVRVVLVVT